MLHRLRSRDKLTTAARRRVSAASIVAFVFGSSLPMHASAQMRLTETAGSQVNYVALQAPATIPASFTWLWPAADGSANQCLATNGAGVLKWQNDVFVDAFGNVGIGTTSPAAALDIGTTGLSSAMIVPRDTTANRPAGVNGMFRYNTVANKFEAFENSAWVNLANTSTGILDGGNSSAAALTIGTNNAQNVVLKASNTNYLTLSTAGNLRLDTTNINYNSIISNLLNRAQMSLDTYTSSGTGSQIILRKGRGFSATAPTVINTTTSTSVCSPKTCEN